MAASTPEKVCVSTQEEHGSKRVSCDEFQKNVDQHVKDELGKLQFPGW